MRNFFFDLASNVKGLQIEVPYFDIFLNVSRRKQFKSGIFLEVWGYFERKLFTFLDIKKNNIEIKNASQKTFLSYFINFSVFYSQNFEDQ